MSDKIYKHCPYSDEFMRKIRKENHEVKLPPIIKYSDKITPEDFYTEEWTGIIFKAGVLLRQGNHYDSKSIHNHLTDCRIRDLLMTGNLFGEFYPDNICNDMSIGVIKPSNASVLFTKIWMDDNNSVHANFKCVNNEYGKIVYDKLNKGLPVYFGIRCICNIYDSSNISSAPTNMINDYNMYCIKRPDGSSAFTDFGNIRIIDVKAIITFDVIASYSYPYAYGIIDSTYPDGKYERITEEH